MGKYDKLLHKLLSGSADTNFSFDELCSLLIRLNFKERIKGSHHIFYRDDVVEIIRIPEKADSHSGNSRTLFRR
jgi:hypothetical protein